MSDQLPNGWTSTCVGELGEVRSGVGFPKEYQGRGAGDYPFAKVSDISKVFRNGGTEIASAAHYVNAEQLSRLRAILFPIGTIAFPKIGEALKSNYRVLTQTEMLFDNNVMGLTPIGEVCQPRYLLQFLRTIDIAPLSVATAVPSVRGSDIAQIRVPLPPLNEQRRIVAKIEALMARVERAEKALRDSGVTGFAGKFATLRQAILAKAFRGELVPQDPNDEPAFDLLARIQAERAASGAPSRRGRRRKPAQTLPML